MFLTGKRVGGTFWLTGRMLQLFRLPYVQNQSVTSLSQSKTHFARVAHQNTGVGMITCPGYPMSGL